MRITYRIRARGQVQAIIALLLGLGVLMGFVALAFDGSSALLQRRNMQNGANASALAAAQMLGESIIWDEGRYAFLARNQDVMAHIETFLGGNRGGVTGDPNYRTRTEYGTYDDSLTPPRYVWSLAATFSGSSWTYEAGYPPENLVPYTTDAVRVTASIDNPTTFAQVIGISSVPVSGRSAAALTAVSAENALSGPTWPITRCQFPDEQPPVEAGICHPFLFWSSHINDQYCRTNANFKSTLQLGAEQGVSWEGAHRQLITGPDPRTSPVTDATTLDPGSDNYESCVGTSYGMNILMSGLWSPQGNCTDPYYMPPRNGDVCCASSDLVADVDVNNFIMNDFQGRISLTATQWLDGNGVYQDWRSADHADAEGDWLEVYNGGNFGNNIQMYFARYVQQNGVAGILAPYYGRHVDKVVYMYDDNDNEVWDDDPDCPPQQTCPKIWQQAGNNDVPGRVHMSQAMVFRFYERLVDTNAEEPVLPPSCDQSINLPNVGSSQIYGMFAGLVINEPPPGPGGHGLYNFIGYIDPE